MRRRTVRSSSRRRGLSLVVVMAALSTAIVVSIAFLHAQATALQASQNGQSSLLAVRAAETGLAAGLDAIQNPAWSGVGTALIAETGRDSRAAWGYRVTFEKVSGDGTEAGAAAAALRVKIRSKGQFEVFGSARSVGHEVVAVVELTPRLPGRPSRPGDVATASDRAADVAGFDQARGYTVVGAGGSESLCVRPQTRIDGQVWLGEEVEIFEDLAPSASQRQNLLTGIGTDSPGGAGAAPPHPLACTTAFSQSPDAATAADLAKLQTSWSTTTTQPTLPAFDPERFRRYRLFAGGFEYDAVQVGSTLQNVSLGPTDSNPLGIFYSNGSLSVRDNVIVRGTLVASSGIDFEGRGIAVTPFDWRDSTGGSPVLDRDLWPVLPAVVAGGSVTVRSSSRNFLEGTVISSQDVVVNTPDYALESALLSGLDEFANGATARPLGGGLSEVRVQPNLLSHLGSLGLTISNQHAVRLNGPNGRWYPIVWSNMLDGVFHVRGTAYFGAPVSCWFQPRRIYDTDIAGPLIGDRIRFGNPPAWANMSGSQWTARHDSWQQKRNGILGILLARPNLTFSKSLAEDGIPFGSTVRVTRPANVNYACQPPLFRPSDPNPSVREAGDGYRWEVLSWQEVSP